MNTPEERIKEAFDGIKMPMGLKEDTLTLIEKRATTSYSGQKKLRSSPLAKIGAALAACFLVAVIGFGGLKIYTTETAVIGIELNPSIELGVNWFGIVIDVRALNEDGKRVLSKLSLTGKSGDEALTMIINNEDFLSYVTDDSFIAVYVVCSDDRQSADLVSKGHQSINTLPCNGACSRVSPKDQSDASTSGMGVSRYNAAQALMSLDPSLTIEECAAMSMRELRERIAELDPTNVYAWSKSDNDKRHPVVNKASLDSITRSYS
jgi:hypothetical protein